MNKDGLIQEIHLKTNKPKRDIKNSLEATLEAIKESLIKGDNITIHGFGSFNKVNRPQRIGTNPINHEKLLIPEKDTITFKPCKDFKDNLNK